MAPTKFEKDIKDKLEKRTIKPSADAWNKLSNRLENQEEKRNNKSFWWLGIAASIVGVLLVITQVFKNDAVEQITPEIVVTPEVIKQSESDNLAIDKVDNIEEISEKIKLKEDKQQSNQNQKKETITTLNLIKETILIAEEKPIQPKNENSVESEKVVLENTTLEEQKIQEVIAQVNTLKDGKNQVTENEVEALLAEAQKEITLEKLYNDATGVVDANLLLQDVETDLEESFRAKVFKALKENFITVKTAVAQRND